jgi:hypothetical protein
VQHLQFKGGWAAQPRDLCLMTRTTVADEDRSIFIFSTSVEHADCAPQTSHVRGDLFVGAVHIRPLDAFRCHVAYLVSVCACAWAVCCCVLWVDG